jgi:hypothetical protein
MTASNRTALFLSLFAIVAAFYISNNVYERLPHLEDEWAYIWQAKLITHGQIAIQSPPYPGKVFIPFVVDYNGMRFGKYPPGWPVVLSFGVLIGLKEMVNPLLAGLGVWLTFRLGKKLFTPRLALLAAFLTVTSPFYLINSGSFLSHSWTYVLSAAFALAWLDTFVYKPPDIPRWLTISVAGLCLGAMVLTRPITAVGVALPFFIHGLILLIRGDKATRLAVLYIGIIGLAIGSMFLLWQYGVTGDFRTNPYTLWWDYDQIGFGPGHGVVPGGHTPYIGWLNTKSSLDNGWKDMLGWFQYSWILLPFGYWSIRKNGPALLTGSVFWSLVLVYMAYWVGAYVYGPRYYYEGFYSMTLVTAAGIGWLAGWQLPAEKISGWHKYRSPAALLIVAILIGYNLFFYLPDRLAGLKGLYGVTRNMLAPFQAAETQKLAPALVIVHTVNDWRDYGALTDLEDPWLTSPFIFGTSSDPESDAGLIASYPSRRVIQYYMDGVLHLGPAPSATPVP